MLVLSEYAAQKIRFLRENCTTKVVSDTPVEKFLEVSAIGEWKDSPNFIIDWIVLEQECSPGTSDFDPDRLAQYMDDIREAFLEKNPDDMDGLSRLLKYSGKVWAHTHPGSSVDPSSVDTATFNEVYLNPGAFYASMFILGSDFKYSNKMLYETLFMGRKTSEESVMVLIKSSNSYLGLSEYLKNIFNINEYIKQAESFGFKIDTKEAVYQNYSACHEKWLQEIKDNVTEQVVHQDNTTYVPKHTTYVPQPGVYRNISGFNTNSYVKGHLKKETKKWLS